MASDPFKVGCEVSEEAALEAFELLCLAVDPAKVPEGIPAVTLAARVMLRLMHADQVESVEKERDEYRKEAGKLRWQFGRLAHIVRSSPRTSELVTMGPHAVVRETLSVPARDVYEGRGISKRCPRCGSTLLRNALGDEWCSFVGGGTEKPCTYGLPESSAKAG